MLGRQGRHETTHYNLKKTHCKQGHLLKKRNKHGKRVCRICQREYRKLRKLNNVLASVIFEGNRTS